MYNNIKSTGMLKLESAKAFLMELSSDEEQGLLPLGSLFKT